MSRKTKEKFVSIRFNAWKYSKSDAIWAAFYSEILKCIECELSWTGRFWFRQFVFRFMLGWRYWLAVIAVVSSLGFMGWLVLQVILCPGESTATAKEEFVISQRITVMESGPELDSTATLVIQEPKKDPEPFLSIGPLTLTELVPLVGALIALFSGLWKSMRSISFRLLGKIKGTGAELRPLTQEDVVKYVDVVQDWLQKHFESDKELSKSSRKLPEKFIVYIDDVDRVPPGKIMQMMEAIKLFLDTPGFVFVLALDARIVRLAIGEHYRFMAETRAEREVLGHDYLEKIIQIPFYLPRLPKEALARLSRNLLKKLSKPKPDPKPDTSEPPTSSPAPFEPTPDGAPPSPAPPEMPDETGSTPNDSAPRPQSTPTPILDDSMDMKISDSEHKAFKNLQDAGLEMSPRQLKQFWNVYFLARHIYYAAYPEEASPPEVFTHWLALSVRYPFEIKELVRFAILTNWPKHWQTVVDRMVRDLSSMGRWTDISKGDLRMLARYLQTFVPSPEEVRPFVGITNCFNLVME